MNRRTFLKGALAASAGFFPRPLKGLGRPPMNRPLLFKISLAEWSLHRQIQAKKLDPFDFPMVAKRRFDIHAVEYVSTFYKRQARDEKAWRALRQRTGDIGVRNVLIMVDGEGWLGDPSEKKRLQAVENHKKWLHAARILGCHSIRVNARSAGSPKEQQERVVDGLGRLLDLAAPLSLNVIVENHGGLSSNGAWLAGVMKKLQRKNSGTLPDFGNFRISKNKSYDRYQGVKELMPFARGVSAKTHAFDKQGNETETDYLRMLKIVMEAGYRGYLGIEYEGNQLSEEAGIRATKKLLERVRKILSAKVKSR